VLDLLLDGYVRVLGQANTNDFHKVSHWTALRTPGLLKFGDSFY
jgi:hypothetical protein